jgi:hypothetical protein
MNRARKHTDGEDHSGDTTVVIRKADVPPRGVLCPCCRNLFSGYGCPTCHPLPAQPDPVARAFLADDIVQAQIAALSPHPMMVLCERCGVNHRPCHHRLCDICNHTETTLRPVGLVVAGDLPPDVDTTQMVHGTVMAIPPQPLRPGLCALRDFVNQSAADAHSRAACAIIHTAEVRHKDVARAYETVREKIDALLALVKP